MDLICHGSPSSKLLDDFLRQYNISLAQLKCIIFRNKGNFSIQEDERSIVTPGTMDCYSIAFLNGLTYTENCYSCYYADKARVSDITIGDSWGSDIESESAKGIYLILCNTASGIDLLKDSCVHLENVEVEKAIATNPQLQMPMKQPKNRICF